MRTIFELFEALRVEKATQYYIQRHTESLLGFGWMVKMGNIVYLEKKRKKVATISSYTVRYRFIPHFVNNSPKNNAPCLYENITILLGKEKSWALGSTEPEKKSKNVTK